MQYYSRATKPRQHAEVPIPSPKKDEVLLKLEAASINPIDWKIQKGMLRPFMPPKFPFIPVHDVAGEVLEVGPGVNSFKAGDKVVSMLGMKNGGGLAEYAVASVGLTVTRPPEVSLAQCVGLPTAAITALQALMIAGVKMEGASDEPANILITAASGGVGLYAVQLAKLAGHHVTATCGARNMDLVKSLGADEVLDYSSAEGLSLKSPSGRKYDSVVHCATGISWSTFQPNLASDGKVIDMNPSARVVLTYVMLKVMRSRKRLEILSVAPTEEELKFVVGLVKEGKLKTVVDSRHPLEKAEAAWAKSMDGHATGKIIVEM
ncbi:putative quinone-oxidoreductase-like protein, chloroplastic [Iris pallida]|uniref:Quinone-oxidoreductase-like protein, chloroplastic n=1 Tax=Iris pallida TaxID=29817 RepID=A0AAX6E1E6_IRIPA|nr:putative quinone-oxidoreductase-like protein, chloroplastic [Iris pallida]